MPAFLEYPERGAIAIINFITHNFNKVNILIVFLNISWLCGKEKLPAAAYRSSASVEESACHHAVGMIQNREGQTMLKEKGKDSHPLERIEYLTAGMGNQQCEEKPRCAR